jgi:hypothetical protein
MSTKQIRDKRKRMTTVIILTFPIFFMVTSTVFAQGLQGQTTRISVSSAGGESDNGTI